MAIILCIEDEADLLESLAEALTEDGHTAIQARDGREGLERIDCFRPDLVICEISMPNIDGYELLNEVRNSQHLAQMPFIFHSAFSGNREMISALEAGADDYLEKPIDFAALRSKVHAILRMNRRVRESVKEDTEQLVERLRSMACYPYRLADDDIIWE